MDLETAAHTLRVHYQTVYRWVRSGLLPATRVGGEYRVRDEDVQRLIEQRDCRPASPECEPNWCDSVGDLFEALTTVDEELARRVLDDLMLAGMTTPMGLCESVLGPVLERLGEEWGAGALGCGRVVAAAGIVERVLGEIAVAPRGRPRGLAVVCSPEGERHRIPSLMATIALRSDRWRVHHLGADVPAADLLDFVQETNPDLVVISVTVAEPAAEATKAKLAAVPDVPVLIGRSGASLASLAADARALKMLS